MQHRYDRINVPTELARSFVLINEAGSFTRAANLTGVTQPAITAQIKRLEGILGGPLFERKPGRIVLTGLGRLILAHCRSLLDANDRIMSLAGVADGSPCRLGIAAPFLEPFLCEFAKLAERPKINVRCVSSEEIANGIAEGYFDLGILLLPEGVADVVAEWREDLIWVKSRELRLDLGKPIPLVAWPTKFADKLMFRALDRLKRRYSFVVVSSDYQSRLTAARLGMGVMAVLRRTDHDALEIVPDYILPAIPPVRAGICMRQGLLQSSSGPIVAAMKRAFSVEISMTH